MSAHTPGPWQVIPAAKAQSRFIVGDKNGGSVADCEPCGPWMTCEEADANARLIAAAPMLVEALQELHRECVAAANRAGSKWPKAGTVQEALHNRVIAALKAAGVE